MTKQEVLDLYLNKIYLGNRAYGAGAAAQIYYGKNLDRLSPAQIAMIAGLPKAPSRDNPDAIFEIFRTRYAPRAKLRGPHRTEWPVPRPDGNRTPTPLF